RPGASVPARADGERDRDVSHGAFPAALAQGAAAGARRPGDGPAPAPQGVPALPRSEQLADAARGAAPDGPRGSDRRRQAPAGSLVAARRDGRFTGRAEGARGARGPPAAGGGAHPAYRPAADATQAASQAVMADARCDFARKCATDGSSIVTLTRSQ